MATLARLLGKYQRPAFILDTSYMVKFSQHDAGAASMMVRAISELDAAGCDSPELVVFVPVIHEYETMKKFVAAGDYNIPKTSSDCDFSGDGFKELSPEIREMVDEAYTLWDRMPKKMGMKKPDAIDAGVVALAMEQAKNSRMCYVFSYDSHVVEPVKLLSLESPCVHCTEESGPDAKNMTSLFSRNRGQHAKRLLIPPQFLGELYSMPSSTEATHYALTTKVPFGDTDMDMMVSIRPFKGKIAFEENGASRHALHIIDSDREIDLKGYKLDMARKMHEKARLKIEKDLFGAYYQFNTLTVIKSYKHGMVRLVGSRYTTSFSGAGMIRDVYRKPIEWLMTESSYLQKFSPETLESLRSFRKEFPK